MNGLADYYSASGAAAAAYMVRVLCTLASTLALLYGILAGHCSLVVIVVVGGKFSS